MHFNSSVLNFLHNRELDELFATITIRGFATSMVGIFIPIYLLTLDYSLKAVLVFFIIRQLCYLLSSFPAAHLSARFGFKHAMLISVPFLLVYFSMLATLSDYHWPLWVLAVMSGVQLGIFWTSYHTDFALVANEKEMGKEVGVVAFLSKASNVAGPLLGGLLISLIGFTWLLVIVNVMLVVSIVPLFLSKDIHAKTRISIIEAFRGKGWKDYVALAASGVETAVATVIWPIFIFFYVVSDFTAVGLIATASLAFSLVSIIVATGFADKYRRLMIRLGAITQSILWCAKAFITTSAQVLSIDSLHGASRSLIQVPFNAKMYSKASHGNALQYVLFRATAITAGATSLYVAMFFTSDLVVGFWIASSASLLFLLF